MSNQYEIELINAANKECDRLQARINYMERLIKDQSHQIGNLGYKIKNQRHEINNRLKENERLRELLRECLQRIPQHPINLKFLEKIQEALGLVVSSESEEI